MPKSIELLAELRTISLDNNKFKEIPNELKALPRLYSISIKKNEIEHISEDFFDSLLGLETL